MAKNSSSKERALERARAREKARMENGQKHKQRRGGSKKGILFMLGVLLVGTLITLCFTVFFQIESIQVTGESIYDAQPILQAAGIEEGQNLLSLNSAKISAKVSTALPYISQVKLHKNLPAQLVIEVVPAQVTRVYLCENTYAWCDSEDKIIELSGQPAPDSMVIHFSRTAGRTHCFYRRKSACSARRAADCLRSVWTQRGNDLLRYFGSLEY